MSVLDNLDCYLLSALEDLIEDGELEQGSKEHGIALQVALRGYGSLSLQQQYLFNTKAFRWSRNTTRNDIGMSARPARQLERQNPRRATWPSASVSLRKSRS